jgi:hypothetical protein
MKDLNREIEELRRLIRSSAATMYHVKTIDVILDDDDKPVLLRKRPPPETEPSRWHLEIP